MQAELPCGSRLTAGVWAGTAAFQSTEAASEACSHPIPPNCSPGVRITSIPMEPCGSISPIKTHFQIVPLPLTPQNKNSHRALMGSWSLTGLPHPLSSLSVHVTEGTERAPDIGVGAGKVRNPSMLLKTASLISLIDKRKLELKMHAQFLP